MQIAIVTGEPSGDIYASRLLSALKRFNADIKAFGVGGINLKNSGLMLVLDIKELSIIGVGEAIIKLFKILGYINLVAENIISRDPEIAIFVDSPDFNFRVIKRIRKGGYKGKVVYFIPPTVWAWRKNRVNLLRDYVDVVITLFEFERDFLRRCGVNACWFGHPLADILKEKSYRRLPYKRPVVGFFPGSRAVEVKYLFDVLLKTALRLRHKVTPIFSVAEWLPLDVKGRLTTFLEKEGVDYRDDSREILYNCDFAVGACGTLSIEALWFDVPMIVVYRSGFLSYMIYRLMVDVKFISMPNIVAGEIIYPEFIQGKVNVRNIVSALDRWILDENFLKETKKKMSLIKRKIFDDTSYNVMDKIARRVLECLQ